MTKNRSSAVSQNTNLTTIIVCLSIAVSFVFVRTGARWIGARRFSWEDGWCWLAAICLVLVGSLYVKILPNIYWVQDVRDQIRKPDADFFAKGNEMLLYIQAIQVFFWTCLWSVKISLLLMFKRLTERVPVHRIIWWVVMVITIVTYIGCIITQLTACVDISKATTIGGCSAEADIKRQAISLYYALAVDVLTDFLVMAIPVSLIWRLQINIYEKLGIGIAFSAGLATVIVALLRGFMLAKSGKDAQDKLLVDITWLCCLANVECCIAVCVNCIPSFAVFVRSKVQEHKSRSQGTYPNGYGVMDSKIDQTQPSNKKSAIRSNIMMSNLDGRNSPDNAPYKSGPVYKHRPEGHEYSARVTAGRRQQTHDNSSQESIIGMEQKTKEVYVTRTVDIS